MRRDGGWEVRWGEAGVRGKSRGMVYRLCPGKVRVDESGA